MNPSEPNPAPNEAEPLSTEMRQFEVQLRRMLAPRSGRLDRDRLLFLAGKASVEEQVIAPKNSHQSTWGWPAACAVSTTAAASLLLLLLTQQQSLPPLVESVNSPTISEPIHQAPSIVRHSPNRPMHILSSAPNQLRRFEKSLAAGYRTAPESKPAIDWEEDKRLTPTSIDFLINEPTKLSPTNGKIQFHSTENGADA